MGAKRVLIAGITANKGGVESYIMEIYRHCDKSKLQFDFLSLLSILMKNTKNKLNI